MVRIELIKDGVVTVFTMTLSESLKMKSLEKYGYSVTIFGKKVTKG